MRVGVSTHLFHDQRLTRDHLAAVAAGGFQTIELFALRDHFDYHDTARGQELAGWLAETGLTLNSVHAPITDRLVGGAWGRPWSIGAHDAARREQTLTEIEAAIGLASVVPFDWLVVHVGVPDTVAGAASENGRDAVRRSLERLHASAERAGVRLALEVIPNALSTPDALVRLLENDLDLGSAGICFDFGHAFLMGDLMDALEAVSGHVVTTHVHDNRGRSDDHLVPFEGAIDWNAALTAVQKVGYEGPLVFEPASASEPGEVLGRVRRAVERFTRIMAV